MSVTMIGIDTAKQVLRVCGLDETGTRVAVERQFAARAVPGVAIVAAQGRAGLRRLPEIAIAPAAELPEPVRG